MWKYRVGGLTISDALERVEKVEDVVQVGDEIMVKVTEIDRQGRINLSRKELLREQNNNTNK